MKTKRLVGMALIIVLMSVCYSACSSSDDEIVDNGGNNYKSLIIGKWKLMGESTMIATHVEYKKDGTFSYTSTKEEWYEYEEHGVYKIDGDILYEMFSDEDDWEMSKINLLNSMSLILQGIRDNGELKKTQYSFQRVN